MANLPLDLCFGLPVFITYGRESASLPPTQCDSSRPHKRPRQTTRECSTELDIREIPRAIVGQAQQHLCVFRNAAFAGENDGEGHYETSDDDSDERAVEDSSSDEIDPTISALIRASIVSLTTHRPRCAPTDITSTSSTSQIVDQSSIVQHLPPDSRCHMEQLPPRKRAWAMLSGWFGVGSGTHDADEEEKSVQRRRERRMSEEAIAGAEAWGSWARD